MKDTVRIFDTTLRDGEQAAGINLNGTEKLQIARQLAALGVDVIEAGFPASSQGDFESVKSIASEIDGPIIAGLARANEGDIRRAAEAVREASRSRIHTFIATSPIHMEHKLKMSPEEVVKRTTDAVSLAASLVKDVEFSAEDASRSDPDFLMEVFTAAIAAGATTINVPDTVGYATPGEFGDFLSRIMEGTEGSEKAVWSVHVHNDLGLAVANSVEAVRRGARQVECTVNGIGERAGNASLEEIVMALKVRRDVFSVDTAIDTTRLYDTSRMVSRLTGVHLPPNKAIVGDNAFAHEAGIHQHGVLCKRETYEIMHPKDVGAPETKLVMGKHSGHHAFAKELESMGYSLTDQELKRAFSLFKELCDKKEMVTKSDMEALVVDEILSVCPDRKFSVKDFAVHSGRGRATAAISLIDGKDEIHDAATGNGPVDASYAAIRRIVGIEPELAAYRIISASEKSDALGEARVTLRHDDMEVQGRGVSTDVIEASIKAYVNGINRLYQTAAARGVEIVRQRQAV
ncbi:MAG: 2-isopropylmalate synthase [Synergistota bacterium]|nr:2-isopropylmalate synthase [Synergistota bacterium]